MTLHGALHRVLAAEHVSRSVFADPGALDECFQSYCDPRSWTRCGRRWTPRYKKTTRNDASEAMSDVRRCLPSTMGAAQRYHDVLEYGPDTIGPGARNGWA